MARPLKEGIDYYPVDVNIFDNNKIEELLDRHGPLGYTIFICILNKVYANGYYLEFDPKTFPLSVKKAIGNKWIKSNDVVIQVMHSCADIGLFDNDLMQRNIITSVGIQERFKEITVRRRHNVMSKYCILEDAFLNVPKIDINVSNNDIIDNNNADNVDNNSTKVKESIYICSEQTPNSQISMSILLKDNTEYLISDEDIKEWSNVFKGIDVKNEIKQMALWCKANPKKRKTRRGALKFITGWLGRARDNSTKTKGGNSIDDYQYL